MNETNPKLEPIVSHQDAIRTAIQWDDTKVFRWRLYDAAPNAPELIGAIGAGVGIPFLLVGVFVLIGQWSHAVAFWVSFVAGWVVLSGLAASLWMRWRGTPEERREYRAPAYWSAITLCGCLVYSMSSSASFIADGFSGPTESAAEWTLFFLDAVVRVVTLDATEVVGFAASGLQPQSVSARLATLVFKFLVTAGIIEMVLAHHRVFRGGDFYGTPQEGYWACQEYDHLETIVIERTGEVVVPSGGTVRLDAGEFLRAFKEEAKADRMPRV